MGVMFAGLATYTLVKRAEAAAKQAAKQAGEEADGLLGSAMDSSLPDGTMLTSEKQRAGLKAASKRKVGVA